MTIPSIRGRLAAQEYLVLRDLTLIEDIRIRSMDIDGVQLENASHYSWADIRQGDVGDKQREFDELLSEIGLPLFRIRTRMEAGHWDDLQPMTDELLSRIGDHPGPTAYAVLAAAFHDRLSRCERETSVIFLIRLLRMRHAQSSLAIMNKSLGLRFADDGICLNLLPVWFDRSAAREAVGDVEQQLGPPESRDSLTPDAIYFASLVQFASDGSEPVTDIGVDDRWQAILSAQSALLNRRYGEVLDQLEKLEAVWEDHQRAVALYYIGQAQRQLAESSGGLSADQWKLTLLQIPASFGDLFPELAAAAVDQVLQASPPDSPAYRSLSDLLGGRYADTWHGRRMNQVDRKTD